MNPAITHCRHGHEYTPQNTLLNGEGWRYCRECNRKQAREYQRRRAKRMGGSGRFCLLAASENAVSGMPTLERSA